MGKDIQHAEIETSNGRKAQTIEEDLLEGFDEEHSDKEDDSDLLDGFEDSFGKDQVEASTPSYQNDRFDWDGYLKLGTSYSFAHDASGESYPYPQWQGISRLRPELYLNLNARLFKTVELNLGVTGFYDFVYDIKGMEEFQFTSVDEQSKYEAELQEAYLYAKIDPRIDIKLGRQIVTWGKADFLPVTNIINPMDLRAPGTPDEGQLPVGMIRLDFFLNSLSFTGITIFEKQFNKIPVYGDEFWPYKYGGIDYDKPEETPENLEYAFALNYRPSAFDFSLYYADIFDNMPYIEPVTDGEQGQINYKHITHARIQMVGLSFSFPFFNTIMLKGEAAYIDGLKYISNPIIPPISPQLELSVISSGKTYSRMDGLLGFEYTGIADTIVIGEFLTTYKIDYQSLIIDSDSESQSETEDDIDFGWSAGVNRSFLNNTVNVRLGAVSYKQKNTNAMIQTLMTTYDLTDAIKITAALLLYDITAKSDLIRDELSDNDRVYLEIKYSF